MAQILFAGILLLSQATFYKQQPLPSGDDLNWVEQRLGQAVDLTLPLAVEGGFSVAYRSSRDSFMSTPESYFAIRLNSYSDRTPPSSLENAEATLLTMTGGSLRNQLISQRVADREATLGALLLRISVRRTTHTAANCPAMKKRLDEFSRLSLPMVPKPKNYIALHATTHEMVVNTEGQYLNATFGDAESPLVRWALATLDTLTECASTPK